MASHDTEFRTRRATSQQNTVTIQKLNEELRKLKGHIDRQHPTTSGPKRDESNKPKS